MLSHVAFLTAILDDPASLLNRLAYADWLDEQRDACGELLRVQGELLRRPSDAECEALARREHELLRDRRGRRAWEWLRQALGDWPDACRCIDQHILTPLSLDPDGFLCPECLGTDAWCLGERNPMMLHWVLNPGLAFNELVLGQRVPARIYTCRNCPGGRSYTRCAECRRFLPLSEPPFNRPGGNWRGLACPECGAQVPILTNVVTRAVTLAGKALTGRGWLWGK